MNRTVVGVDSFRICIEQPDISRESLLAALACLRGKPFSTETLNEAETIVSRLLQPVITVMPMTTSLLIELPLYQHIRRNFQTRALKIAHVIPNPRGVELHFENQRYAPIQVSNGWAIEWGPQAGSYYLHAQNGEPMLLSGEYFESKYTLIEVGA